jgi:hypothetical protein
MPSYDNLFSKTGTNMMAGIEVKEYHWNTKLHEGNVYENYIKKEEELCDGTSVKITCQVLLQFGGQITNEVHVDLFSRGVIIIHDPEPILPESWLPHEQIMEQRKRIDDGVRHSEAGGAEGNVQTMKRIIRQILLTGISDENLPFYMVVMTVDFEPSKVNYEQVFSECQNALYILRNFISSLKGISSQRATWYPRTPFAIFLGMEETQEGFTKLATECEKLVNLTDPTILYTLYSLKCGSFFGYAWNIEETELEEIDDEWGTAIMTITLPNGKSFEAETAI